VGCIQYNVRAMCYDGFFMSEIISKKQLLSEPRTIDETPNKRKVSVQFAKLTWEYPPGASSNDLLTAS
jgi:hypothetical protein